MITLTESAATQLTSILDQKGLKESHGLRVFVKGGGCGGMQYGMTFDEASSEDDEIYETNGVKVLVDPASFSYVTGSNIDYQDSLMGGGVHIDNPNAVSSCGCGSSFRTAEEQASEGEAQSCGY